MLPHSPSHTIGKFLSVVSPMDKKPSNELIRIMNECPYTSVWGKPSKCSFDRRDGRAGIRLFDYFVGSGPRVQCQMQHISLGDLEA